MTDEDKPTGKHVRINETLLSFLERPTIRFLVTRLPRWVTSDLLTGFGTIASVLVFVAYVMVGRSPAPDKLYHNGWLLVAALGFILNWFGDSLDGSLARYRHIERPRFGYFLDHAVDGVSAVLMFLGIGFSTLGDLQIASFALIGYLLAMIHAYLKTYVMGVFVMSNIGLGPTEVRLMAIILNIYFYFRGQVYLNPNTFPGNLLPANTTPVTLFLGIIAAILLVYYVVQCLIDAVALSDVDEKARAHKIAEKEKEQIRLRKLAEKQGKQGIKSSATNS